MNTVHKIFVIIINKDLQCYTKIHNKLLKCCDFWNNEYELFWENQYILSFIVGQTYCQNNDRFDKLRADQGQQEIYGLYFFIVNFHGYKVSANE